MLRLPHAAPERTHRSRTGTLLIRGNAYTLWAFNTRPPTSPRRGPRRT